MDPQSLLNLLYSFLGFHPTRIKTFAELILAVIKTKSVAVKEMALHISSEGHLNAKIKKIERFLLHQDIDFIVIGKMIIKLLHLSSSVKIAIDRTNWQFGKKDINFFVAAVVYGNISIPIAWLLLNKKGNSCTQERKQLIEDILKIIPKEKIEIILADREFIGEEWFSYLNTSNLSFAIRVKRNERIKHQNGGKMKLGKYFSKMQAREIEAVETAIYDVKIKMTCLQLESEQLFIASNVVIGDEALLTYRRRWSIERSFRSLKTSGFNIEDTHITDLKKLGKLFAIVSMSLAICLIAGQIKNEIKPIKTKKHGRKLFSLFTYGIDWLKDYFCSIDNDSFETLFLALKRRFYQACQ